MASTYSEAFRAVHASMMPHVPVEVFDALCGSSIPHFAHDSTKREPVALRVKLCGAPNVANGCTRIQVAPWEADWYAKLKEGVGSLVQKKPAEIELVDYLGEPIQQLNLLQLMSVGELDVVDARTKREVRLNVDKAPEPPAHMVSDKSTRIRAWVDKLRAPVADVVAQQLQGHSMAEIAEITRADGPLQQAIEHAVKNSVSDWRVFAHDMAMDDLTRAHGADAVATDVSRLILGSVRRALKANEQSIKDYHVIKRNAEIGADALWSQHSATAAATARYTNDYDLYVECADDAMHALPLERALVYTVSRGGPAVERIAGHAKKEKKEKKEKKYYHKKDGDSEDPMRDYYHRYYYKVHGHLPEHVMKEFNARAHTQEAPKNNYPGDAARVQDLYSVFCGAPIKNIEKHADMPALVPLENVSSEMPALVPLASGMPELIPLEKVNQKMPELVPLASGMPALVPLEKVSSEMPELVPLASGMPALVPLKKVNQKMPELVPLASGMPALVPLGDAATRRYIAANERELENEDVFTLDQFL